MGKFFSKQLERKFREPLAQELLWLMCDEKLGSGMTREVFSLINPESEKVIKIETQSGHFQNVNEFMTWERVMHTDLAKWFAPCYNISHCGRIMIAARCEPIAVSLLPAEVPSFFTDLKKENWGMYKNHPVALDYGKHLMLEKGMSKRIRKANWT